MFSLALVCLLAGLFFKKKSYLTSFTKFGKKMHGPQKKPLDFCGNQDHVH